MHLGSKFYFNDGAAENGGGGSETTTTTETTTEVKEANDAGKETTEVVKTEEVKETTSALTSEEKAELEELRKFKAEKEKPALTEDEIQKAKDIEKVELRKFAIEKGLAKDEDFTKFETLSQKQHADIVFEDFIKEYKADNASDFSDDAEIEAAAKEAFEEQYHLNSENKTLKARGLKLLEKDAKDLLNPYETKINTAKAQYDGAKQEQQSEAELKKAHDERYVPFREAVKKAIPEKVVFGKIKDGDSEVLVELDVTQEERDEAEKKFLLNHKTFFKFQEGKPEEVQAELLTKINNYLLLKKHEEGMEKYGELREGIGTRNGSNIGAENPFALKQGATVVSITKETLEESNKRLAELRARQA